MQTIEQTILEGAKKVVMEGLRGIKAHPSFDIGKVDYSIPQDQLEYRISMIARRIIHLVQNAQESINGGMS